MKCTFIISNINTLQTPLSWSAFSGKHSRLHHTEESHGQIQKTSRFLPLSSFPCDNPVASSPSHIRMLECGSVLCSYSSPSFSSGCPQPSASGPPCQKPSAPVVTAGLGCRTSLEATQRTDQCGISVQYVGTYKERW